MTEAMQLFVAAMGAELERQRHEGPIFEVDYVERDGETSVWTLDGRFDLEKVARAGLEAIEQNVTVGLILAGAESPDSIGLLLPKLIRQGILDGPL